MIIRKIDTRNQTTRVEQRAVLVERKREKPLFLVTLHRVLFLV
jgi:hypothetical protein